MILISCWNTWILIRAIHKVSSLIDKNIQVFEVVDQDDKLHLAEYTCSTFICNIQKFLK